MAARRAQVRRREEKRVEARELREQADSQARKADELAQQARTGRQEAQLAAQRANEIDPDVER
jgi:uncharacterized coiled-coil DUF342 family protein